MEIVVGVPLQARSARSD